MPDEAKFTQDDLDREIKARLARQTKQHEAEMETTQAELTALRKANEERAKAETAAALAEIEQVKAMVDPVILELLPAELTPTAQVAWLRKAAGQLPATRVTTPKTPLPKVGAKDFEPYPIQRKLA